MSDFTKVKLQEYQSKLFGENETRTVVIIAESDEAAQEQLERFVEHLNSIGDDNFIASPLLRLENFHVTFTDKAWEALKASD